MSGTAGSNQSTTFNVSNVGGVGSLLNVSLASISAGYGVTGLPINNLTVGAPSAPVQVSCTVPQANGTLVVQTNEPGNPQYTYNLTCVDTGVPPVPTVTPIATAVSGVTTSSAANIVIFDPAMSKLGFLLPGQSGAQNERIEWIVTISNLGNAAGINVVVSDTLNTALRIDRVDAPGGTVNMNGQTVTVTYAVLNAGQSVQFSIFTTVISGIEVDNSACLRAANLSGARCVTGQVIRALPSTGETPLWARLLPILLGVLLAAQILKRLR
jgi:hypothetical protein